MIQQSYNRSCTRNILHAIKGMGCSPFEIVVEHVESQFEVKKIRIKISG